MILSQRLYSRPRILNRFSLPPQESPLAVRPSNRGPRRRATPHSIVFNAYWSAHFANYVLGWKVLCTFGGGGGGGLNSQLLVSKYGADRMRIPKQTIKEYDLNFVMFSSSYK